MVPSMSPLRDNLEAITSRGYSVDVRAIGGPGQYVVTLRREGEEPQEFDRITSARAWVERREAA